MIPDERLHFVNSNLQLQKYVDGANIHDCVNLDCREMAQELLQLREQNKALIQDAEKLAVYAKEMYSYLTEEGEEWDSDVEVALDQHEELMKQYE